MCHHRRGPALLNASRALEEGAAVCALSSSPNQTLLPLALCLTVLTVNQPSEPFTWSALQGKKTEKNLLLLHMSSTELKLIWLSAECDGYDCKCKGGLKLC